MKFKNVRDSNRGTASLSVTHSHEPKATHQKFRVPISVTKSHAPKFRVQKPRTKSHAPKAFSTQKLGNRGCATLEPSDSKSAHATTHAFAHVWSQTHHRTNAFGPPHYRGQTRPLTRPGTGGACEFPDELKSRWTLCFPRMAITPPEKESH